MMSSPIILVVDDDRENLVMIQDMTNTLGYHTVGVEQAEDAVSAVLAYNPALVVLDMSFPGLEDGLSIAEKLRNNPHTAHIPILAVTAAVFRYDRQTVLNAGCDAYLAKPFRPKEFRNTVASLMSGDV